MSTWAARGLRAIVTTEAVVMPYVRDAAAVVVLVGGVALATGTLHVGDPAAATYAVPGGTLTVRSDLSATYVPDHAGRDCGSVDFTARDEAGQPFIPFDANGDGLIDCGSDIELGG